jgi:hypothetical protein
MLGDEELVCEQCGTTSVVTFWRFEGLSHHGDRDDSGCHERPAKLPPLTASACASRQEKSPARGEPGGA